MRELGESFVPYDRDCLRAREIERRLGGETLSPEMAMVHRAVCEHCMMIALLSSETALDVGSRDA